MENEGLVELFKRLLSGMMVVLNSSIGVSLPDCRRRVECEWQQFEIPTQEKR
jgi:hypothetical protein